MLQAFDFGMKPLKFIQSYLFDRVHRVKTCSSCIDYGNIEYGVLKWSISGPLFFNIPIFDFFFDDVNIDLVGYVNGTTPYAYVLENEKSN